MARLFQDITVTVERRQVAIMSPGKPEKLGFFHKWSYDSDLELDYALVENVDGTMEYVRADLIRFLPIGNEVAAEKLERIYREELGLLKG